MKDILFNENFTNYYNHSWRKMYQNNNKECKLPRYSKTFTEDMHHYIQCEKHKGKNKVIIIMTILIILDYKT